MKMKFNFNFNRYLLPLVCRAYTDAYHLDARITVTNLTNKVALYNFLSSFSGTHFVTPRSLQAEMKFRF